MSGCEAREHRIGRMAHNLVLRVTSRLSQNAMSHSPTARSNSISAFASSANASL